jgi:hypothetical protein
MFRRREGDDFLLVTQVEHARLAAKLAAHVGNRKWTPPQPRDGTLLGVELHDSGWPLHDDAPTIDADGYPTHAFEMPWQTVLPIWSESTRLAAEADPYAGLLVSLHGLALSAFMFKQTRSTGSGQASLGSSHQTFAINKFQHQQIEIQESLRKALSMATDQPLRLGLAPRGRSEQEDRLLFNFRLLEMADRLSVNICFGEVKIGVLENVPTRPGSAAVSLNVSCMSHNEFAVDPWPFDQRELKLELEALRVKARTFSDNDDLRKAIAVGTKQTKQIRLRQANGSRHA